MKQFYDTLIIKTSGPELINVTERVLSKVKESTIKSGLLNLSILHTSASLLIQENTSREVLQDLLNFYDNIAPKNRNYFHNLEGQDDMPAHIKSSLTNTTLSLSILENNLVLGQWQGVFLFEHRFAPHSRQILVHMLGQTDY